MHEIVIVQGPGQGSRFALDLQKWNTDEFLIGRSKDCHLLLQDTRVSKHHSRLFRKDGSWHVQDLGSRNGIYVDGERVEEQVLSPGDRFQVGSSVLCLVDAGSSGEAPTVAARAPAVPVARALPAHHLRGVDREKVKEIVAAVRDARQRIRKELARVVVGQETVIEDLLVGLLARGHSLLEGVPGLAKTLLVSTLAAVLDLEFKRIQFTPDLMPADITGTEVLEEDAATRERHYRFIRGPIFTNILLADEINRTPPKTQAALLEAMQEFRVTAAGTTYSLTPPFYVLATQNPIEQEGTYPLPEAQLDRFMMKIVVTYPSRDEEVEILRTSITDSDDEPDVVLGAADILKLQELVRKLPVSDTILYYAADLARATRPGEAEAAEFVRRYVSWGAGPRAAQYLTLGAKARALLDGRVNVTVADVHGVARQVLRHRIGMNFQAVSEGVTTDNLVERLLEALPEPRVSRRAKG